MNYEKDLIVHKLLRWERYLQKYALPDWNELPDLGLYMDQVVELLSQYLDFMPADEPGGRPITPTTINNYVRLKVMPPPEKKRYYRIHIAYLIVIFTLKQSVRISCVQQLLPADLSEEAVREFYSNYGQKVREVGIYFTQQSRLAAQDILGPGSETADDAVAADATLGLIIQNMLMAGFSGLLAEKLLALEGATLEKVLPNEFPRNDS